MAEPENDADVDEVERSAEYYRAGWEQVFRLDTRPTAPDPLLVFGQPEPRSGHITPLGARAGQTQ